MPRRSASPCEIVPGVSAFSAVAAIVGRELTIPEVAQSVILTRLAGGKTPMPAGEEVREFARHGTTMALFLSAARVRAAAGGAARRAATRPRPRVVVAYQATWPDELVVRCTLGDLAATVKEHRLWKHTLFLVGPALAAGGTRSHLYHPGHFHGFRRAEPTARAELRRSGAQRRTRHRDVRRAAVREPDLPRTAKVRPRALRTGWTTGTCASAAAKAAATALATGVPAGGGDRAARRRGG